MKTSINFQPVAAGSERHNERRKNLDYVRADLTPTNESWSAASIRNMQRKAKDAYWARTGRKMPTNTRPIREAVVTLKPGTTMEELHQLADNLRQELGIEIFQIHIHRDEGHQATNGQWVPNLHAHLVANWMPDGKSVALTRADMRKMQDITAQTLHMDRGVSSNKQHLSSIQYKVAAQNEELAKLQKAQKSLETMIKNLQDKLTSDSINATLIEEKIKDKQAKLTEIELKIEQATLTHAEKIESMRKGAKEAVRDTINNLVGIPTIFKQNAEIRAENEQLRNENYGLRNELALYKSQNEYYRQKTQEYLTQKADLDRQTRMLSAIGGLYYYLDTEKIRLGHDRAAVNLLNFIEQNRHIMPHVDAKAAYHQHQADIGYQDTRNTGMTSQQIEAEIPTYEQERTPDGYWQANPISELHTPHIGDTPVRKRKNDEDEERRKGPRR